MMDMTVREIDAFAKGHDRARRANMATALWAVWNGAVFNAHGFAGKRLPNLDTRINEIMGKRSAGNGDMTLMIDHMRKIAKRRGLPPPKRRMN